MSQWSRAASIAGLFVVALVGGACPEPDCTYVLTPTRVSVPPGGGSGNVSVTASRSSCAWDARSNVDWLTVTSGSSGTGTTAVSYTAAANPGPARTGTLAIANGTVTVTQDIVPTFTLSGRVTDVFIGTGPRGDMGLNDVAVTATGPGSGSATTTMGAGGTRGNYTIGGLPAGAYTIAFSKAGYSTATSTIAISGDATLPMALGIDAPSPPSTSDVTGYWVGTGDYFNAPFRLALIQTGTAVRGDYIDRHDDTPSVSGTYAPGGFSLHVYLGDTGFYLEITSIDNARQMRGVQRVQGHPYAFTMTR